MGFAMSTRLALVKMLSHTAHRSRQTGGGGGNTGCNTGCTEATLPCAASDRGQCRVHHGDRLVHRGRRDHLVRGEEDVYGQMTSGHNSMVFCDLNFRTARSLDLNRIWLPYTVTMCGPCWKENMLPA